MTDLDSALANAKLPERTVPLCLRGDLQAEYEDLERQLALEQAKPEHDSLAGNPRAVEIEEQLEALREQMQEATVTLRVRALSNRAWYALAEQHPPREGNDIDALYGCNFETLAPELVRRCLVPKLDNDQWELLYAVLSNGQFETLFVAAHGATRGRVNVPKSLSVSAARPKPAETPS
jgi:hypothetical protein